MNQTMKRYAISSAVTFLTAVAIVILTNIDHITSQSFTDGTVMGILFVAVRAGVKGVLEAWVGQVADQPQNAPQNAQN